MLILQAERDAILKPLQAVTGIVERKHTLPILSNVLIEKHGDSLSLLASDLEIQILTKNNESLSGEDFRITTSAKKLQEILRAMPDKSSISIEQKDGLLTLKAGKSRFNLQTLPADEFPLLTTNSAVEASIEITQRDLRRLLSQVQYSMASQDIRYYLNGLLLQTSADQLRLVATDGHRLAYASGSLSVQQPECNVILPRKTVIELYKLLTDSEELISIELLSNQVRFQFGHIEVISKIIEGKFPDYNRVIPLDNNKLFLIGRLDFLHALQRAAILANEKFRGVRLVIKPGIMSILCTNNEQEEAEEELEVDYSGDSIEIGFNINYLLEVLNNLNNDNLQLAFGDGSRSALITIPDNPCFKYVVMPMRI